MVHFLKQDNRGASLLIVLGMFVLLTVVATNMLMLVNAGNVETAKEYETEQTFLTVSSVYEVLDERMRDNIWADALLTDAEGNPIPNQITVTGLQDENGADIAVTIDVNLNKNLLTADYHIDLQVAGGHEKYLIKAKYSCSGTGDDRTIALKECEEMVLE